MLSLLLAAVDRSSSAYQAGYQIGQAIFLLIPVGCLAFFIVSLIKACTRKSVGWIVSTVLTGVLSVVMVIGAVGFFMARTVQKNGGFASTSAAPKTVTSKDGKVTVQVPGAWREMPELHDDAILGAGQPFQEQYCVVLPSGRIDYTGDLKAYDQLMIDHMQSTMPGCVASPAEEGTLDGHPVIRHRLEGEVDHLKVVYYATHLETEGTFYQILCWTLQSKDAVARPALQQVADSFRLKSDS